MATMKKSTQVGLLVAALVVGAIAAAATRSVSKAHVEKRASNAIPELAAATDHSDQNPNDASSIQGKILEIIQVPRYTYLRIGESGQPGTWAAVTSARDLKMGDPVRVVQAQAMENFQSTALNRKFDKIYFGALEGPGQVSEHGNANPHAGMDMSNNPHGANGQAMPPSNPNQPNPHAQVPASADSIPVGKVAKAKGQTGYTVAEIYAQRQALAGKVVRIRAVVVKSVPGVMGKTFIHVRDGSGNEKSGNFDLTITTQAEPQLGDTLLFEGKFGVDVDFGAGYKYPAIVQDAQLVTE
jgi:hypothetical protein